MPSCHVDMTWWRHAVEGYTTYLSKCLAFCSRSPVPCNTRPVDPTSALALMCAGLPAFQNATGIFHPAHGAPSTGAQRSARSNPHAEGFGHVPRSHSATPTFSYFKHSLKSVNSPCNDPQDHLTPNFCHASLACR